MAVAGPMETALRNPLMGIDTCSSVSRPTTLLLEKSWSAQDKNNNMMLPADSNLDTSTNKNVNRRRKKKRAADVVKKFEDLYEPTGETLGQGSFGAVSTYRNLFTSREYAVKVIQKTEGRSRHKVLKEIEIFHHCKGHDNILQLVEYFEQEDCFYLIFEKMEGGSLLETIERRGHLTEQEASLVIRDIAKALSYLHMKGIAHRDLKPENILCAKSGKLVPVKLCDFDLGSGVVTSSSTCASPSTTPELLTPVGSAEFMAPEVVDVWVEQGWSYDKRCDLWSLGIITYIMLCGYPPFYGQCGEECGWENGESCQICQDSLFNRIQNGEFDFPEEDWRFISDEAKDLIRHLLVRNPIQRYSAEEVLSHQWVSMESPQAQLATPHVLLRNNSVKELEAFAENANAVNRMILRHLSISEALDNTLSQRKFGDHSMPIFSLPHDKDHPLFTAGGDDSDEAITDSKGAGDADKGIFIIGDVEEISDEEQHQDEPPVLWMGLSPPGESKLARRRQQLKQSTSNEKSPTSASPPKVPSAMF